MNCPNCGSELPRGASFCTRCGNPVAQSGVDPEIQPPQNPQQASQQAGKRLGKGPMIAIIGAVVAVIAAVAVIIAVFVVGSPDQSKVRSTAPEAVNQSSSSIEKPAASVNVDSQSSGKSSASEPDKLVFSWGYVQPSGKVASKLEFVQEGSLTCIRDKNGSRIGFICVFMENEDEGKRDNYDLGTVVYEGKAETLKLSLYRLGSNGKIAHWGSDQSTQLALEKLCGITPQELAECIFLETGSGFQQAELTAVGPSNSKPAETKPVSSNTPFWGIWMGASKDKAEMEAEAENARKFGYADACVCITSDWSNLNSETWYVVTAGRFATEQEANAALGNVVQKLDPSAYVKYTGDFIG